MCEAVRHCKIPDVFWVQSIPTQHNILTCNRHLAMTIRELQDPIFSAENDPESPYYKDKHKRPNPNPNNNYANITVKMRYEQDNGKVYWR